LRLAQSWALCFAAVACGEVKERPLPEGPEAPDAPDEPHTGRVRLRVGDRRLGAGEETVTCWSRTLDNEAALYLEAVSFTNLGSFHHSNWFVVPQSVYEGPDGTWDCAERGFEELSAALSGAVLFAQSTQAWTETQRLSEGAVIKVPPRSKIVADLHLLNLSPTERETEAWLELHLVHPWFVDVVLKPMMLAYYDLRIPAQAESRFTARCEGLPNIDLYYALPHYHATGNYFSLQLEDDALGPLDLFSVEGFSADVVGQSFDVPIPFGDYDALRFTCGYDNWLDRELQWGIGADEMCVMLGLIDSTDIVTGVVLGGTEEGEMIDGVRTFEGPCQVLTSPAGEAYRVPRVSELAAPLYVPPVDPRDEGTTSLPTCEDADPTATPAASPTLDNLRDYDLDAQLRPHIARGNPDGSVLYEVLSRCEPEGAAHHMPLNAPVLLDDSLVAMVRAWIENLPAE
jgi:hypothetical protein